MFRKKDKPDSFGINGSNCEVEYLKKMILGMDRAFEAFALKTVKRIEALEKSSEEDVIKDAGRVTKPNDCYGKPTKMERTMEYVKPDWLFIVNYTDNTKTPAETKVGKLKVEDNKFVLEGMTPDEFEKYWMLSLEYSDRE